jgi:release factor glutamine methyltransferase
LDVGTGSGCIAATIAAERSKASIWATEISPDACDVARLNLKNLGVSGRVTLLEGDLFAPISGDQRFDVIVSNPPYVTRHEVASLSTEVRQEPVTALDGGEDGLAVIRRLIEQSKAFLKPGGLLAFEISETQGPAVLDLLSSEGYQERRISKDLAHLDRFAYATVAR